MREPAVDGYVKPSIDPADGLLIQQLEKRAEYRADWPAMVTDQRTVTLGQLNGQANAICKDLMDRGVAAGAVVVLHMAHGIDKVVAAIGVLKSGATYAAVDPHHKDRGIRDLVDHTETRVILTDRANQDRIRALVGDRVSVIEVSAALAQPLATNAGRPASPDDISTIIYTSGSTGAPKGVMYRHGGDFNAALNTIWSRRMTASDRIGFLQSFWFSSLMAGLLVGATIHPFDLRDEGLGAMKDWLRRHRITYFGSMVAGMRQLLESLTPDEQFPDVRAILVTGEALLRKDLERFDLAFPPDCMLTSTYSSTECLMMANFTADRRTMPPGADAVPLGFPVLKDSIRVVDPDLKPVAPGTVGEIIACSTVLTAGYWRNPALTEKTYIPDPDNPTQRIYRTGDLAVVDAEGCLHGLGRVDQQVKVRGHRVMTGEIETMLAEHPAIKAAVVVLDQVNLGGNKLVGYVIGETETVPTTSALRAYLGRRLPDHMLPSVIVPVKGFTLTATGKVNRRVLPRPVIDVRDRDAIPVPPANDVERALQDLWQELLDIDGISVEDDFFLIGGDSVMALTMFLKLEERLGRRLPFESLWLQGSTIRALAAAVAGDSPAPNWAQALPLQTNGDKPVLFVVSMVSAPVYCLRLIRHLGGDQPVYGLPAKGVAGGIRPDRRVEDMAAHCITMIRQAQPTGPYRLMGHSAAGLVAFETARQLRIAGEQVDRLVLLDSDMPGTTGRLAGKIMRQPLKAARLASSLVGQSVGRTPSDVTADLQAARTTAYFRYRPKPYHGDAVLVTCRERRNSTALAADWRRLVRGRLIVEEAPGDHISMLMDPQVRAVATILDRHLSAGAENSA